MGLPMYETAQLLRGFGLQALNLKKTSAMQQDILINWSPQETRVAVVENGAVQELHVERTLERGLVGNVYLGKVARVLPGMQSAFIDIGLERAAFLHVADVWHRQPEGEPPGVARNGQPQVPIEKQVFEGQSLMVQVIKDPIGTKGARLSTQISIAGRLLVFLPQDDHVGVSQKIPPDQRDALRARLQALVGPERRRRLHPAHQRRGRHATPSWPRTSPTCARPGRASARPRCACRRRRCCTRT